MHKNEQPLAEGGQTVESARAIAFRKIFSRASGCGCFFIDGWLKKKRRRPPASTATSSEVLRRQHDDHHHVCHSWMRRDSRLCGGFPLMSDSGNSSQPWERWLRILSKLRNGPHELLRAIRAGENSLNRARSNLGEALPAAPHVIRARLETRRRLAAAGCATIRRELGRVAGAVQLYSNRIVSGRVPATFLSTHAEAQSVPRHFGALRPLGGECEAARGPVACCLRRPARCLALPR